jgi:hypothetical protein
LFVVEIDKEARIVGGGVVGAEDEGVAVEGLEVLASEVEDSYQVAANEKAVVRALEARRPLRNDPAGA